MRGNFGLCTFVAIFFFLLAAASAAQRQSLQPPSEGQAKVRSLSELHFTAQEDIKGTYGDWDDYLTDLEEHQTVVFPPDLEGSLQPQKVTSQVISVSGVPLAELPNGEQQHFDLIRGEDIDELSSYYAPFTSASMLGNTLDSDEIDLQFLKKTAPSQSAGTSADGTTEPGQQANTESTSLVRDQDDFRGDGKKSGDDPSEGDLLFLLVTSFDEKVLGSGKVWVIPKDLGEQDKGHVIIGGLQKPVGVCFDPNNNFLYVVDLTSETTGAIYQYEIVWSSDKTFDLRKPEYVVVYEGESPYDCAVDEYGNLFFVDPAANQVNMINYLDLWSGFLNQHVHLYSGVDDLVVSRPVAIEAYQRKQIFWLNSENGQANGLLIEAPGRNEFMATMPPFAAVRDEREAFGLAVSDHYVYYTLSDGSIWAYDRDDRDIVHQKSSGVLQQPRGACYGEDNVYVVDHSTGTIYQLEDDHDFEIPAAFVYVKGAYGVHCVNDAIQLAITVAMFLGVI